jgi:flagellar hook-associated protein 3 FlgL
MGLVMKLRSYDESLAGYIDNGNSVSALLGTADDQIIEASEVMTSLMEQAEQGSTGTYSDTQLNMIAEEMEAYLDSLVAISATKSGDQYIFSGDAIDSSPYTYGLGVTVTGDSPPVSELSLSGEIDSAIMVEFTSDGTVGTDSLDYKYSTDGGTTWETGILDGTSVPPETTITIEDATIEIASGTVVTTADEDTGSSFIVRTAMIYQGTDEAMSVNIAENYSIDATTVGYEAFGGQDSDGNSYGEPNLFESICETIAYLQTGNTDKVEENLEKLSSGNEKLNTIAATIGAREDRVDYMVSSLGLARERTASAISSEEDINAAQLSIELNQAEYVYEAVLSSASKSMSQSILDYI